MGIATYHYFRIFNSWNDAFDVKFSADAGGYVVSLTGAPFNDAYRYVDWVLTVPLLLIELILVMGLPAEETVSKSWKLGVASAAMVALGYPGEIQDSASGRWMWWFFAMLPFLYVVAELAVGLGAASQKQAPSVASLTAYARWLTIISWLTYPFVYIIKMLGISGVAATAGEQIGYSCSDVLASMSSAAAGLDASALFESVISTSTTRSAGLHSRPAASASLPPVLLQCEVGVGDFAPPGLAAWEVH